MKKINLFIILFLVFASSITSAQVIESHRNAANTLWSTYGRIASNPSEMPNAIPMNVNSNVDQITIAPTFNNLESALNTLLNTNGGILKFNNSAPATIKFKNVIHLKPSYQNRDKVRTIVIQGKNITFDGQNKTSLFLVRGSVRLVIQDAKLTKANFKGVSQANLKNIFRSGGGAIEVAQAASYFGALRVRNCQFTNNKVSHFRGIGENQNGGAIRINNNSTAEIFGCTFNNNSAVTGGAIGATSIERLTIINSSFDANLSNGYESTNGYMNVVEGAGALRVDRTVKPVEIFGSNFTRNSANVKVSVMEVFIAPVAGSSPGYPNNKPALVINNCNFENNKYNNYAGVSNFKRVFFAGCVVFHGSSTATMKLTNSVFNNNEVGQANIRLINNFEFDNCTFANTKFLDVLDAQQQGAVFLQRIPSSGVFNNCTFYKNEPRNENIANDIMFWQAEVPSRVTLKKSIFYRTNKTTRIKQVRLPLKGNGNNQYIPNVNMSSFAEVSNSASNKTNPNINPKNIVDMCLGPNSLPANIGGIPDCGSGDNNNSNPQLLNDGTYFIESTTSNQRLLSRAQENHNAKMENPGNFSNQMWVFKHQEGNIYTIKNLGTNRFLEVPFAKCKNSTQVATWTDVLGNHQKWKIVEDGKGTGIYGFLPAHCLTQALDRNNGEINANVITYSYIKNNNQKWKIMPLANQRAQSIESIKNLDSQIKVFPNPAKDILRIAGLAIDDNVTIHDIQGKTVMKIKANSEEEIISISSLQSGLYIVLLPNNQQLKLVVK